MLKVNTIRKIKHVVKFLEKDRWYIDRMKGSHRQFKHPVKLGTVTVAGKMNADIKPGTLKSILQQAELTLYQTGEGLLAKVVSENRTRCGAPKPRSREKTHGIQRYF